jgi:hypothetical protein
MLYFIVESVKAYFSYPIQTSVSTMIERLQTFSAVNVCDYSPLRYDHFIESFLTLFLSPYFNLYYTFNAKNEMEIYFIILIMDKLVY